MHTHYVCQYLRNQVTVCTFTTHLSCQNFGGVVCDVTVRDCTAATGMIQQNVLGQPREVVKVIQCFRD